MTDKNFNELMSEAQEEMRDNLVRKLRQEIQGMQEVIDMQTAKRLELSKENQRLRGALEKLARLGSQDGGYGNSIGNIIAQQALQQDLTTKENNMHSNDILELKIAEILKEKNIDFIHESEGKTNGLDFYIPTANCYIECKAFHADRVLKQLERVDNVILIQGYKALDFFTNLTTKE